MKAKTWQSISFTEEHLEEIAYPREDVIVITAIIKNAKIHRLLVDTRNFGDILCLTTFKQM